MHNLKITPRQYGKTTELIEKFIQLLLEDKGPVYVVAMKQNMAVHIAKTAYDILRKNNITRFTYESVMESCKSINSHQFDSPKPDFLRGVLKTKEINFLVDEYLFFDTCGIARINRLAQVYREDNFKITAWSTARRKMDPKKISAIKSIRTMMLEGASDFAQHLGNHVHEQDREQYAYLYDNLITDPDCTVKVYSAETYGLSREQFELEILGNCLEGY